MTIQSRLALRDIAMAHSIAAVEKLGARQRVEEIPAARRAQIKAAVRNYLNRPSRMDDSSVVRGASFATLPDLLVLIENKIRIYVNREFDAWRLINLRAARRAVRIMIRREREEARAWEKVA